MMKALIVITTLASTSGATVDSQRSLAHGAAIWGYHCREYNWTIEECLGKMDAIMDYMNREHRKYERRQPR
jgi:hypothetical protein